MKNIKIKFKKTGDPKISVVLRISGRTFEFPVERSKSEKRVIRKFRPHPQKSYKNHIETYKNHIKSKTI